MPQQSLPISTLEIEGGSRRRRYRGRRNHDVNLSNNTRSEGETGYGNFPARRPHRDFQRDLFSRGNYSSDELIEQNDLIIEVLRDEEEERAPSHITQNVTRLTQSIEDNDLAILSFGRQGQQIRAWMDGDWSDEVKLDLASSWKRNQKQSKIAGRNSFWLSDGH
jgi:hypothetical protein